MDNKVGYFSTIQFINHVPLHCLYLFRTELVHFANEHERQQWQEKVGEMLADKVMYIAEVRLYLNLIDDLVH